MNETIALANSIFYFGSVLLLLVLGIVVLLIQRDRNSKSSK
jgi:uncharacterized membrane protein